MKTGEQLKLKGIDQVAENNSEWLDCMRTLAIAWAQDFGYVCADDLRPFTNTIPFQPNHPNAWGAVFRGRHWKMIGRRKSRYTSNHAREIKVWRYKEAR